MNRKRTLEDYGYPIEGILDVDKGGGDFYQVPQEALSPRTCEYCRKFDSKEWVCTLTGEDKCIDDTCDRIDHVEEWLDNEYGFRSPVRQEYSSDKTFEQACKAIKAINRSIKESYERDDMW